jgi:hypothetical protein
MKREDLTFQTGFPVSVGNDRSWLPVEWQSSP